MEQAQRKRTGLIVAVLVILGLTAGAVVGLLIGWVLWPVKFVDTSIADLAPQHQDEYCLLVASAFVTDGDLEKAQARLAQLEVPNVNQSISALIDRCIVEGRPEADIRALAALANALGVVSPQMLAYLATPTPLPTDTPLPTPTPLPTDTPTPTSLPTDTAVPPTDTPSPQPTDTPPPPPTNTPVPPTKAPKPKPANTAKPQPTNTPKPTSPPAAKWTIVEQRLVGPGQDSQSCAGGNLMIRVTVLDAGGNQIPGVWIHDHNTGANRPTGHKGADPYWGPGEAQFDFDKWGGGRFCITTGEGGACESPDTREMPCYVLPPVEDLYAAGYCSSCCGADSIERCREVLPTCFPTGLHHFSWRVVFKRSW